MKARLNQNGVVTLTPENDREALGLRQWADGAWVARGDVQRMESGHWRGSRLIVSTTIEPAGPHYGAGINNQYKRT